jgi:hypothetical protein
MSKIKKEAHVANTKFGMGDFYGSGIRNKTGRMRDSFTPGQVPVSKKGLKKPPKSLA